MKTEHPKLTSKGAKAPVLQSVSAQGTLEGLLLTMELRQSFRNDTTETMEVVYTFPLAWGAVLLGLEASVGGKRMAGQIIARQEARERYEKAVEDGDAPIMVEKAQGGVFSASLGGLKPGEEAVIALSYAQLLAFEHGRIRLVVPTTIAPRYGDAIKQGKLQPEQVAEPDLFAEHGFTLSITLAGTVAQARIGSPSHAITQQRLGTPDDDSVQVSLQGGAWLDRDFVLLLDGLQGQSFAVAGPDARSAEGHLAVIASFCLALPSTAPSALRLKMLIDCSGSMAGQSIGQARDALRPLAAQLLAQDRVAFSRFGNRPQRVLEPMEASARNVKKLLEAIDQMQADLGGTEMADALSDTFELPIGAAQHAEEADVLLIADGEVWDAQAIVDLARRSGHRVYALGVGSAPAESLLREMAEATCGACECVSPGEDMAQAVQRLLARIRLASPVHARLEVQGRPLWASPLPRRIAAGETVHTFLRLPGVPQHPPALQIEAQVAQAATLTMREDDLVARLVAAHEIGATADKGRAREIAQRYQLVTEDTNLLLVIERAEADKTNGMPTLHKVQPMLAAGWGGTGQVAQQADSVYRRRPVAPLQVLRSSIDNMPANAMVSATISSDVSLSIPSVWRTNRTRAPSSVEALASGGMDDFEIPAFLRKQADEDTSPPAPATASPQVTKTQATPSGSKVSTSRSRVTPTTAMAGQIIQAFNQAASLGQAFRSTLRAVTDLNLETQLSMTIVQASAQVGGPVKAWACYLLWLHKGGDPELQLSPQALALVLNHLKEIPERSCEAARLVFQCQSGGAGKTA